MMETYVVDPARRAVPDTHGETHLGAGGEGLGLGLGLFLLLHQLPVYFPDSICHLLGLDILEGPVDACPFLPGIKI